MSKKKILVVGSANMDLVATVKEFPRPGETLFGTSFGMFPGGKGANQAVCCAKLGAAIYFVGRIGTDVLGERLVASMRSDGVRLDHLVRDEHVSTGIALIAVNRTGQNEIVVVSGSNMRLSPADINSRRDLFATVGVLLVQLESPLETVRRTVVLAKAFGAKTILNPAPARRLPGSLLKLVDYVTPNEIEAEILTGVKVRDIASAEKAAKILLEAGVQNVLMTLGKKGSLLMTRERTSVFPALRVKAVDTTAAGDAFNGALAVSIAEGKSIDEAVPFATKVAAISVTSMGAQRSMPSRKEVATFDSSRGQ